MTYDQIANRIEKMPLGPFAMLMGFVDDSKHVDEVIEARKMMVEALRGAQALNNLNKMPSRA